MLKPICQKVVKCVRTNLQFFRPLISGRLLPIFILSSITISGSLVQGYRLGPNLLFILTAFPLLILLPLAFIWYIIDIYEAIKKKSRSNLIVARLIFTTLLVISVFNTHFFVRIGQQLKLAQCGNLATLRSWGVSLANEYDYPTTGKHIPKNLWPPPLTCIDPRWVTVYKPDESNQHQKVDVLLYGGAFIGSESIIISDLSYIPDLDYLKGIYGHATELGHGIYLIYLPE